jgi:glycosyltransferase involved in cell wall biosynthesis
VQLPPQIPVAVFLTAFEPGGTERQMIELIRRLDPERFRVHVACFHRAGAWLARAAERAASVTEFPISGLARPGTLAQMLAFARWCRREHIAVVQTCDLYANIFGLPAAALARVPVRIGSRRELNPDKTPGQIRLQRQAYRFATKVVANSSAAQAILVSEGLATTSTAVVANGVDVESFPTRSLGGRSSGPTLITVANLRREKNHETLIAAVAALAGSFPALRLRIAGAGPRRQALESLAESEGLLDRVEFLGHREDVGTLLADADVFVLPSRSEAFPNGAIEAMAAGLPVIASAVGGLRDLIDDGRTGLLVQQPDDAQAFAAAVHRVLTDGALAARLGAAARAEVRDRYSFERMVHAFEDLYVTGLPARALAGARRAQAAGL